MSRSAIRGGVDVSYELPRRQLEVSLIYIHHVNSPKQSLNTSQWDIDDVSDLDEIRLLFSGRAPSKPKQARWKWKFFKLPLPPLLGFIVPELELDEPTLYRTLVMHFQSQTLVESNGSRLCCACKSDTFSLITLSPLRISTTMSKNPVAIAIRLHSTHHFPHLATFYLWVGYYWMLNISFFASINWSNHGSQCDMILILFFLNLS